VFFGIQAKTFWPEGVVAPKNPMVGSFAGYCAQAACDQAAAAPPNKVMNSRRFS
jgi:hypothetical protein